MAIDLNKLKRDISELRERLRNNTLNLADINTKLPVVLDLISVILGGTDSIPNARAIQNLSEVITNGCKSASISKNQLDNSANTDSALPCHTCTRQTQKCSEHCEALNAHLDGVNKGKLHGERTSNIDFDRIGSLDSSDCADSHSEARSLDRSSLAKIQKVTAFDPLEPYQTCWDSLSLMQRKVIQLHLGEGIKQKDIAKKLKKSPSTISNHLKKAKEIKTKNQAELRAEQFNLIKKNQQHSNEH